MLAAKGARVIFTSRSQAKGEVAREEIIKRALVYNPSFASPELVILSLLDLSDLSSVKAYRSQYESLLGCAAPIDALILNAGVMALATRQVSVDGHEMQFATNCLGHFAFTCELIDLVRDRVVTLSSSAQDLCRAIPFDDLDHVKHYSPFEVYAETKLMNMIFTQKLARLLEEKGSKVLSVACHPGITRSPLFRKGNAASSMYFIGQSQPLGTTPTILAVTDLKAKQGGYAGPWLKYWGEPKWNQSLNPIAKQEKVQDQFWKAMEEKTSLVMDLSKLEV